VGVFILLELVRSSALVYTQLSTFKGRIKGRCFVYILNHEALVFTAVANGLENVVLTGYFVDMIGKYVELVPDSSYMRAAMREGVLYGLVIMSCGLLAALVNGLRLLGDMSDMIYIVEWTLASRLILMQLEKSSWMVTDTTHEDKASAYAPSSVGDW
jgi:hypothetical protein